jgi:epoxide hydrolase 4
VHEFSQEYDVWAPDMRGYNNSDSPDDIADYHLSKLMLDVVEVIQAAGYEKANIVSHDWGGIIAWSVASVYPEVVNRLVSINAPNKFAYYNAILRERHFKQIANSWYVFFFQIPGIPEYKARRLDCVWTSRGILAHNNMGQVSRRFVKRNCELVTKSIGHMYSYYRNQIQKFKLDDPQGKYRLLPDKAEDASVSAPTLILWGKHDIALITEIAALNAEICSGYVDIKYVDSNHWVPHNAYDETVTHISDFLRKDL